MRTTTTIPDALRSPDAPPAVPPEPDTWGRVRGWIDPPEGFTSLACVALLLLITIWTVEGAGWVKEMPALEPVALAGVLLGFLLAKIRIPSALLHPLSVVVGALMVIGTAASVTNGENAAERLVDLGVRLGEWWEIAQSGGISSDPIPFVFQVVILAWVVAYTSSWFVFRSQQIWLGVVPSGIALLVNLTYLPGRFTGHFLAFVVVAMLLASRLNLVQKLLRWRREGTEYSRFQELSFVGNSLWVGAAALLIAYTIPTSAAAGPVADLWERYGGPWRDMEREFDRLFASVSSGKAVPLHGFGRQMPFRGAVAFGQNFPLGGSVTFGRDLVMNVQSDAVFSTPPYWRAAAYDSYTGQGWVSSARVQAPALTELQRPPSEVYEGRKQVTITVEVQSPTDVLFSAGIPLTTELSNVTDDLIPPASYTMYLREANRLRGLPLDLRTLVPSIPGQLSGLGRLPSEADIQQLLPPDVTVRSIERRGAQVESINVTRLEPYPPDSLGQRSLQRLNRGQKYAVTSWVSEASEDDLKQAGTEYPGWVLDRYVGLPRDLPQRIRDLADEWTAGLDSPYDKAIAIESQLRAKYEYSLDITQPPQGRDGVEHFLFYLNKGYCDYFASAMAVMLRAEGIPARVAVGYVTGDYDSNTQSYAVREPHAHAWPEVYFPKYGWVEFNPTPAWPSIFRPNSTTLDPGFDPGEQIPFDETYIPEQEYLDQEAMAGSATTVTPTFDWVAFLTPIAYGIAGILFVLLAGRTAWMWGLRGLNPAAQSYEKVSRLAALSGNRPRTEETPAEFSTRLGALVPDVAGPVRAIADSYARHRFSKRPVSPDEAREVDANWRAARKELFLKVLRWRGKKKQ